MIIKIYWLAVFFTINALTFTTSAFGDDKTDDLKSCLLALQPFLSGYTSGAPKIYVNELSIVHDRAFPSAITVVNKYGEIKVNSDSLGCNSSKDNNIYKEIAYIIQNFTGASAISSAKNKSHSEITRLNTSCEKLANSDVSAALAERFPDKTPAKKDKVTD
jgi:hypothetical protein